MKTLLKNILATTSLTLLVLGVIATAYGGKYILISSVFESLLVNVLIHSGLLLVSKLESKYYFVEILYEVVYVLFVLVPSGYLFGWYSTTPLWIVMLMGVIIYVCGCFIQIFRVTSDVTAINRQIQVLKQKQE